MDASRPLTPSNPSRFGAAIGIISMASLLYLTIAIWVREDIFREAFTLDLDPWLTGSAVNLAIFPIAIVIILSNFGFFQRIILGQASRIDKILFGGMMALVQAVFIQYSWVLDELDFGWAAIGLLIPIIAGLLGGWRIGLITGLVGWFMEGTFEFMRALENEEFLDFLLYDAGIRDIWDWFRFFYLLQISSLSSLWAGVVAGQLTPLLGRYRFAPWAGFLTGFVVEIFPTWMISIGWPDTGFINRIIPAGAVSGIAMVLFVLIARNIEGAAARRQAEAAQLALTEAELRALRAQINPHFLFNSLNTIRYFVRTDQDKARQLLLNLSDVFQSALKSGDFVPLSEEIEFTKSYLELEKARLDERLEISWFIQSDTLLQEEVPTLILQPIVENAVIHGIAPQPDGGRVAINIVQKTDALSLQVIDTGRGMSAERLDALTDPTRPLNGSIAITNIRHRLNSIYNGSSTFEVQSAEGQGTTVEVTIPIT